MMQIESNQQSIYLASHTPVLHDGARYDNLNELYTCTDVGEICLHTRPHYEKVLFLENIQPVFAYVDGLVQDLIIYITNTMETLQSCTNPSMPFTYFTSTHHISLVWH